MPNWCHNTLRIEGEERDLDRFKKRATVAAEQGEPLAFASFVPEPEDTEDWYSWRIENWGTKWEPTFRDPGLAFAQKNSNPVKTEGQSVVYKFDTAWAPPSSWLLKVSRLFPALRFSLRYAEVGCDFAGEEVYIAGNLSDYQDLQVSQVLSSSEMWF